MTESIEYPYMRSDVLGALCDLSNPAYQERHWLRREPTDDGSMYGLEFAVDALFENNPIDEVGDRWIGLIFYDQEELRAVQEVTGKLRELLDELGWTTPDVEFVTHPAWPSVVESAARAAALLHKNDRSHSDNTEHEDQPSDS